jgi:molybdopterin-guanine dinucleotide biosynthesis protein A
VTVHGCILAGGASSRYGSPKALAPVGGVRVVDRVAAALRAALRAAAAAEPIEILAIVNDAGLAGQIGLRHRPDILRGVGPLAGVHSALHWARELGANGVLAAGCDMPFLEPALLADLVRRSAGRDVVIPASEGPRGMEPLCAFYGTGCLPAIEAAVARRDTRMVGFHDALRVEVVPLAAVRSFGDPARMFLNVNTEADRLTAERLERVERP